ncbi:MAG: MBL fold metallo-hydrolase [Candidatus Hermodarchaeia archaeon]|jgi:glyoxylase-like metal-dependent hydrolase (beta-lactamase superfamily II)
MYSQRLNNHLYVIDLNTIGIKNFIASYVLIGNKTMIIETGPTTSINNLLVGLNEIGIPTDSVDYVAVSHIHIDHAGGADTLLKHLPKAQLLVHAKGAPHLMKPTTLWTQTKRVLGEIADMYGRIDPVPERRIRIAKDGTTIDLGEGIELTILETLGHASHHLSYYENHGNGVFTGDAAGVYPPKLNVVIPTTPPPYHLQTAFTALDYLKKLAPERLYYTHFGMREDAIPSLDAYQNQLKLWSQIVIEAMADEGGVNMIYERILDEDASMNKAASAITNSLVFQQGIVEQSIKGLMGYFKKREMQA